MPPVLLDLNSVDWEQLLSQKQFGAGSFIGRPYQRGGQRGKGLGGVLATLFRLLPTFLGSTVGQELVKTGKSVVSDISDGASVGTALKRNARQSIKSLTGLGPKRIKRPIGVLKPHLSRRIHLGHYAQTSR